MLYRNRFSRFGGVIFVVMTVLKILEASRTQVGNIYTEPEDNVIGGRWKWEAMSQLFDESTSKKSQ